jgi:hypothetical protein
MCVMKGQLRCPLKNRRRKTLNNKNGITNRWRGRSAHAESCLSEADALTVTIAELLIAQIADF